MPDLIYYCVKEDNNCPRRNECERYLHSDMHECKATLFKSACIDNNNRTLFIKIENTSTDDEIKEDDSTEQAD